MNERAIELYKDALRFAYDNTKPTDNSHVVNTLAVGKFAELIIKECSELTLDFHNDEHYRGWVDYREEIRKHFGVE
jgi:hypothetical protein